MTKIVWLALALSWGLGTSTQIAAADAVTLAAVPLTPDAERVRITAERDRLEAGFNLENAACYQKFLVSNCLDEVKLRRRDALADLRRQEVTLNALERKAKAAGQIRKTEERSSPENQQQDAEKRAASLKDFQIRMDREKQKNAARAENQSNEPGKSAAEADRIRGQQEKAIERNNKQAAAPEALRKFNERQEKARERRAQHERDASNQTKPVQPLPLPN